MTGVIDYGMGNLRSVWNALKYLGADAQIVQDPTAIESCDRIIVPGVGAYAKAAHNLRASGLADAIRVRAAEGVPVLGICLGMQLLSTTGTEPIASAGLNLIEGT